MIFFNNWYRRTLLWWGQIHQVLSDSKHFRMSWKIGLCLKKILYCKRDFKSKASGKNTPPPSLELPWCNFILSAPVLNLNEWQLGIMKGIKIKSVAIFQVLTTAKVAVYEEVLSTGNSLFTQSCLIRKDNLKHLTDTEYFRYVLGEHICSNAKFTRCIFYISWLEDL